MLLVFSSKDKARDENLTHVFDQKHSLPTDLRPQILDHKFASVTNARSGQDGFVGQRLGFALERELLPFDIELCKERETKRTRVWTWLGRHHTWGSLAARAALTSATVVTSADLLILSETGRPLKSFDLPVAAMVSEVIV